MSTPEAPPPAPAAPGSASRGAWLAVAAGAAIGLVLIGLSLGDSTFAGRRDAEIEIRVNGLDLRTGRDVLLPPSGFVLQVELPADLPEVVRDTLEITLREERTGTTIPITDRFAFHGDVGVLVVPESLGLIEGLFSIRARLRDEDDHELVRHRRMRIRTWLGGPPIGSRQVIHFDFTVDRDGDGRPDFERDLEALGLASPDAPELAKRVARDLTERALARVLRAYDPTHDPNGTHRDRDTVFVRFLLEAEDTPVTTRICVGGTNATHPGSLGNVRFDARNAIKGRAECEAVGEEAAAGLFPREIAIYREDPLYREVIGPFDPTLGGVPLGRSAGDARVLDPQSVTPRLRAARRALEVLGNVLGTVMAHEAAHALGLVAPGRPGVGLFGGDVRDGAAQHHNRGIDGGPPATKWLMNEGRALGFADLAGLGAAGELRFRPLNHAYLKDRLVLIEGRTPRP